MNMNTIEFKWALREKQNRDTKIEQNNKMSCHDNKDKFNCIEMKKELHQAKTTNLKSVMTYEKYKEQTARNDKINSAS